MTNNNLYQKTSGVVSTKKTKLKDKLFIYFHKKSLLKCLNLVLKYTGVNLDLATRKKIENGLLHPIREDIKRKKRLKEQRKGGKK